MLEVPARAHSVGRAPVNRGWVWCRVEAEGWSVLLSRDWNLDIVRRAAEDCVHASDRVHWLDQGTEHPHRIALSVHKDMVQQVQEKVQAEVDRAGYSAQFIISGSGDFQYMDILSIHGGKRKAMEYVRRIFGVTPTRVVAAGDSGNDILMLQGAGCVELHASHDRSEYAHTLRLSSERTVYWGLTQCSLYSMYVDGGSDVSAQRDAVRIP